MYVEYYFLNFYISLILPKLTLTQTYKTKIKINYNFNKSKLKLAKYNMAKVFQADGTNQKFVMQWSNC